ncbi:MAG: M60 family metallopeptidase [Xanthomonadales bacterium]|nr:M60 family metallopeptidase [Xanthomonadales bacterium]
MVKLIRVLGFLALVCAATAAPAQVAQYPFDGDANDAIGGNHASTLGSVSFTGGGFAAVSEGALLVLPAALTEPLLVRNFEVEFDFRLASVATPTALFTLSAFDSNLAIWQTPGVALLVQGGELVISFSDGVDSERYEFIGAYADLAAGQWYHLAMAFDPDSQTWRLSLDDGVVQRTSTIEWGAAAFRAGLGGVRASVGGVDGVSVGPYTGAFDIDTLTLYAPAQVDAGSVNAAYQTLRGDLNGTLNPPISAAQRADLFATIVDQLPFVAFDDIRASLFAYTDAYEAINPPLYADGQNVLFANLPFHAQVLQHSQQFVLTQQFVTGRVAGVEGVVFEHHQVIPGVVAAGTPRVPSATVVLNASYAEDIAAPLVDAARVVRPTGYYAAPGELVTIRVPPQAAGQGLSIIVGVHFRNMVEADIGPMNRFPDISTRFALDSEQIQVANPMGGGIYLEVPDGSQLGMISATIEGAIRSPYFSARAGAQTAVSDWLNQVASSGAPWADFESDRFMFSVPATLLTGVSNPDQIMARWDAIIDAVDAVGGRSGWQRPRAEFYIGDTRLVTPAFGAGYPMVIPTMVMHLQPPWNPLAVIDNRIEAIFLHELGHNQNHPTLTYGEVAEPCHEIEAESVIHILALAVYHSVYGDSLDTAFTKAVSGQPLSVEQALFDWIITADFRRGDPIAYDESMAAGDPGTTADDILEDKDQIKYQARGLGNRADIARLFGIGGLGAVNAPFYQPGVPRAGTACPSRPHIVSRDEYIRAASAALGVNLAPLFHLWGIQPSAALREQLAQEFPPSEAIRSLIISYRENVAPRSYEDYLSWHNQIFPLISYQRPRYEFYLSDFDANYVADIDAQFGAILETYFGALSTNYSYIYWNPAEPGWGLNLQHQGDLLYGTWYSYADDGQVMFLTVEANRQADGSYAGPIYRVAGTPFEQINGSQAFTAVSELGSATLRFDAAGRLSMDYVVSGTSQSKQLERFAFALNPPSCFGTTESRVTATNYSDLWWNDSEAGWGLTLSHQGDTIFALWYTYGEGGRDQWISASAMTLQADGSYSGALQRPAMGTPLTQILGAAATTFPVPEIGEASLSFSDGENGVFSYRIGEVAQSKVIKRFVVVGPDQPKPLCR